MANLISIMLSADISSRRCYGHELVYATIFDSEPTYRDINQTACLTGLGSLNCQFLSALATTVNLNPLLIKRAIFDDIDENTVYVKLWDWNKKEHIVYEMPKDRDSDGSIGRYKYSQKEENISNMH